MSTAAPEPVIYREEVRAILFALSDMVVELRKISDLLGRGDEEEKSRAELQRWAEDHPIVKLLRELAAKIDVELAAKRAGRPAPPR